MPRLTNLADVLFPVEEHPLFVSFVGRDGERRLPVPEKRAIVNGNSRRVLGIVSRGYRLVTNAEALDLAYKCCRTVFPETKPAEWEAKGVDGPSTGGHCHIDLLHNSTALDFAFVPAAERPEVFGPFIRVTNSYNGLRALGFDIGFYRKICKNGMIVPDIIISFKFTHVRSDIGDNIQFEVAHDRLAQCKAAFTDSLASLRNCAVPRSKFDALISSVFLLRQPQRKIPDPREAEDWHTLCAHLAELSARYTDELGENAYAAFNAITDFASHPPENRCVHREGHSLQRLAGSWLTSFNDACRQPGFSIAAHLEQLEKEHARTTTVTSASAHAGPQALALV